MAFNAGSIEATLTLNRNPFTAGLAAARSQARGFTREKFEATIGFRLDDSAIERAKRQLRDFARQSRQAVAQVRVERVAFDKLVRDLREFGRSRYTATVNVNTSGSSSQLNGLINLFRRSEEQANRSGSAFTRFGSTGHSAFRAVDGGARAFLATLPLILTVGGSAITGLIGLIGALSSALATAGAGLGAFALVGATVFRDIVKAADLSGTAAKKAAANMAQIENARRSLQRVTENAAQANVAANQRVADAEESLRRTVENAARQKAAAQRQVESATRSLERAQENARLAQERLTEARRDAREELEDLQLALRGGAISEEQAILDLEEAQLRLAEARKAGVSGNDMKQLELDVRRAALEVDVAKERYIDLKQESAEWAKTGIEGSRGVVDAQRGVRDANLEVQDAERNVALAREEAAQTALDASRDIADAEKNLSRARADAAQTALEGQRAIADAQAALAEQQRQAAAQEETFMTKRTAAFMAAVAALKALKAEYEALVHRTQDPVADAFTANLKAAAAFIKTLDPIIIATANALTVIGQKMEQYFGGPLWKQFVDFIAANVGPTLLKLFDIIAYGTQGVMNLVMAFGPLGQWLLDKLVSGMKEFATWTATLGSNPDFQRFIELAKQSLPIIGNLIWSIVQFMFKLSVALAPVGNLIAQLFTKVFDALSKLPPEVLATIALALGAIIAALILGASGPVALTIGALVAVGAALKSLYDNCVPFRDMINRIWEDMKSRFGPIFEYLANLFTSTVGPAFERVQAIFEQKFLPSFERLYNFLAPIIAWLIKAIGEEVIAAFEAMLLVVENVIGLVSGIIDTFIGLVTGNWQLFWDGLKTIAESVLGIILGLLGINLDEFYATISGWWESIKTGWNDFWNWLGTVFENWWNEVTVEWNAFWSGFWDIITNFWQMIQDGWNTFWTWISDIFMGWVNNVTTNWNTFWNNFWTGLNYFLNLIRGAWDTFWNWVWTFVSGIWDNIQKRFDDAWAYIQRGVEAATNAIGTAWRAIANFFRDPINWVINVVFNDGILNGWNTVMGWIGASGLTVGRIPEIPAFAEGGKIRGPGTGTSDSILAQVSNGEFIVREAVAKRHLHFLNALNNGQVEAIQAAGGGNNPNAYPRYAGGGSVQAGLDFARSQVGKPYVWGGVGPGGYDCSGFMSAITNVLTGRAPHRRVGTTGSAPWPGWAGGLNSQFGVGYFKGNPGHMAGTLAGVNVESSSGAGVRVGNGRGATNGMFNGHMSLPQVAGQFVDGGGGGIMASLWSIFGSKVEGLFNGLLNFAGMPGINSPIGQAITQIPKAAVAKTIEALKTKLSNMFTSIFGGGASGDPAVVEAVRGVAARYGWGSGPEWDALSQLIAKESSWNPAAANPRSSARGLFQKMTSIHGPVEGTPAGQAEWGLNYIRGRYGSPSKAWAFHSANNYYDKGGMLMPGISPVNTTGVAERILSPQQTADFERLVNLLEQLVAEDGPLRSSTGGPMIGTLAVTTTPRATAQDIVEEATYQMRKARRQGVYGTRR